jgi:hypothetical protein
MVDISLGGEIGRGGMISYDCTAPSLLTDGLLCLFESVEYKRLAVMRVKHLGYEEFLMSWDEMTRFI